jgi:type 1 glutamine amidotransferase
MTRRALVFSGGGDYADPWHGYAETSELLAEVLRAGGLDVEIVDTVDSALTALDDQPDLLAVNAGAGPDPHPDDERFAAGALAHLHHGGGLFALHLSSGLFPQSRDWETALGARWIWDVSGHPAGGAFPVLIESDALTSGIDDFEIVDEAYADLRLGTRSRVLAAHEAGGRRHPLIWTRQHDAGRVAVDLLGHDAVSFDSAEHRELLGRVAEWAAGA